MDEFTDTVNKRKFKEAFDMARNDPSFLGQVLTAGMSRLQYGLEDAREAAMNTLESIKSDKEQKNNYTAVIATPRADARAGRHGVRHDPVVLGAGHRRRRSNPAKLADGISHALVSRCSGSAIVGARPSSSTPSSATGSPGCTMDVGHIADDLLTQMYHNSKKPAGRRPPPRPPPPHRRRAPPARAETGDRGQESGGKRLIPVP